MYRVTLHARQIPRTWRSTSSWHDTAKADRWCGNSAIRWYARMVWQPSVRLRGTLTLLKRKKKPIWYWIKHVCSSRQRTCTWHIILMFSSRQRTCNWNICRLWTTYRKTSVSLYVLHQEPVHPSYTIGLNTIGHRRSRKFDAKHTQVHLTQLLSSQLYKPLL